MTRIITKNKPSLALAFAFLIMLNSCLFEGEFQSIIDDFEVGYVDMKRYRNLYYRSQGILNSESIIALGNNDRYIFFETVSTHEANNTLAKYYILDINKYKEIPTQMASPALFGPLTKDEFTEMKDSLGIASLNFTKAWNAP